MVRSKKGIVLLSLSAALLFWIADAVLDSALLTDRSFPDVLLFDRNEVAFRLLVSFSFLLFGLQLANIFGKQKRVEEELKREIAERAKVEDNLRESENFLQNILRTEPECVKLIAPDNTLLMMNPAGLAMIEADSIDQVRGKPISGLVLPEHREAFNRLGREVFQGRSGTLEFQMTGMKGKRLWLRTHAVPLRSEKGEIVALLGITRDITEHMQTLEALQKEIADRKQIEGELRRHEEQLEAAVIRRTEEAVRACHLAAIGELAAGVAHEVNNPANGVINYAQILANRLQKGTTENEIAGRIITEGERIARIVQSLLTFARGGSEEKVLVHIADIFSESLALTGAQMERDGIIVRNHLPSDLLPVRANLQQMRQVFLNVMNNARYALNQKYPSPHSNKILAVSGERVAQGSLEYIRIVFRDHGAGIVPAVIGKVMNPFFTTKPEGHGTGLGLSISHRLVRDHGGDMAVRSKAGEFTEVIIDLPAHAKQMEETSACVDVNTPA